MKYLGEGNIVKRFQRYNHKGYVVQKTFDTLDTPCNIIYNEHSVSVIKEIEVLIYI